MENSHSIDADYPTGKTGELQVFKYNGSPITFNNGQNLMVNATEMAKPFGKLAAGWLRNQSTQDYIAELAAMRNCIPSDLVRVINGDGGGTWMHEDVAMEFARWLSPKFAIWCNDRIKELLTKGMVAMPGTLAEALRLAADKAEEAERLRMLAMSKTKEIKKLKPKADFADKAFTSETLVSISQAAKILKLPFGRNTLFKKLREAGVFFKHKNEPMQKFVAAGYFRLVQGDPIETSKGLLIPVTVYCYQKGLAYINTLFGGNTDTAITNKN